MAPSAPEIPDKPHGLKNIVLDEEGQDAVRKAKQASRVARYRKNLREERGEVETYAQRAAATAQRKREVAKKAEETDRKRLGKVEQMRRCIELYAQGMPKSRIAVELNRSANTIGFWLKDIPKPMVEEKADPITQALADEAEGAQRAIADDLLMARDAEEQAILEHSQAQKGPADQYQAYVAAQGIRMLRDNFKAIRGPRTVRELSELDQLIRRNLGLNPRGGNGGSGSIQIDVSILNNTKATPRTGVAIPVDAEEVGS